jgi:DNA-binding NtrC family response regulator
MHEAEILRLKLASLQGDAQDPTATGKKLAILKEIARALVEELDALSQVRTLNLNLNLGNGIDLPDEIRKFEVHFILSALVRTGGHQTEAAQLLGLKMTTLNQKLRKLGISARHIIRHNELDIYRADTVETPR